MKPSYDPDTQPFELAFSNLPFSAPESLRIALVDVEGHVDMAKRILLQHKVKNFLAADVVRVAEMIMARQAALEQRGQE